MCDRYFSPHTPLYHLNFGHMACSFEINYRLLNIMRNDYLPMNKKEKNCWSNTDTWGPYKELINIVIIMPIFYVNVVNVLEAVWYNGNTISFKVIR